MRRLPLTLLALGSLFALPANAFGWNERGHKTVAYIAYQNLSTSPSNNVRKRVDDLLKLNPYYPKWTQNVPAAQRGLAAFLGAAVWPDDIKSDGAYGESPDCAEAVHTNAFQDKERHRPWHYLDIPFSFDGTPVEQQCPHNARTIINAFRARLAATSAPGVPDLEEEKAYDLTWLIHLVGDIHQPLHATGRFSANRTHGDSGGNKYKIKPFTPAGANSAAADLHTYWDHVLGDAQSTQSIGALAGELTTRFRREPGDPPTDEAAVAAWLSESFVLARYFVYELDKEKVGQADPAVSDRYNFYAQEVARQRIALAGYRLADLLNQNLK
ncbi:MAG: S1/P1 nuclease [Acidobacteria bacterium]|nr:S1/P1 nuclease [Acidobacteriota bacterium]